MGALGLVVIQTEDKSNLIIQSIKEDSVVAKYNASCNARTRIEAGDYITMVNRVQNDRMLDSLQLDEEFEITVKKSTETTLTVPKNGSKLGLNLAYSEGKPYVVVKDILDGAVKEYNSNAIATKQLKVPSRIVKVDGVSGDGVELFQKLQKSGESVELTITQPNWLKV